MGKPSVDLTGQRFGELVVIGFAGRQRSNQTWRCKCACGSETVKLGYNLKNGHTASCGCRAMRWRKSGDMNRSHGMRRTRTYRKLIPHMVKSDQLLMRAKLKIARDASAISAKEGA